MCKIGGLLNMNKIPCGGFYVGDGLEIVGKELKLTGGGASGDNVFIIDEDSDDFNPQSTEYGNRIKDALLSGKTVYYKFSNVSFTKYNTSNRTYSKLNTEFIYSPIVSFGVYKDNNTYYLYLYLLLTAIHDTEMGGMVTWNNQINGIAIESEDFPDGKHETRVLGPTFAITL